MGRESPFFSKAPCNTWDVRRSPYPWLPSEMSIDQRKETSTSTEDHQTAKKMLDQEILLSFFQMQSEVLEPLK